MFKAACIAQCVDDCKQKTQQSITASVSMRAFYTHLNRFGITCICYNQMTVLNFMTSILQTELRLIVLYVLMALLSFS